MDEPKEPQNTVQLFWNRIRACDTLFALLCIVAVAAVMLTVWSWVLS